MARKYVPDAGDIVWVDFTPQAGHEQAGHRPALVLSSVTYNSAAGMMVCCSMTSQIKGYPFEVAIRGGRGILGVVLSDQVKSVDWRARNAKYKSKAAASELTEIRAKVVALIGA